MGINLGLHSVSDPNVYRAEIDKRSEPEEVEVDSVLEGLAVVVDCHTEGQVAPARYNPMSVADRGESVAPGNTLGMLVSFAHFLISSDGGS
jgi:hypothetical protein